MDALGEFLASPARNQYISVGTYEIYVRKGVHMANKVLVHTFDIANIQNKDEWTRGQGGFRVLLKCFENRLKQYPKFDAIYIESVLNDRLAQSLPSMGFTLVEGSNPPSFMRYL